MNDSTFTDLGLLVWYKDYLDERIDPVQISIEYIGCKNGRRTTYGTTFKIHDFDNN